MGLRVAGTVLAALGVEPDQRLERSASPHQSGRKVEHLHEGPVPNEQAQLAVHQRKGLIDQIERCLQRLMRLHETVGGIG
jgi:hypothetical protein